MKILNNIIFVYLLIILTGLIFVSSVAFAQINSTKNNQVSTSNAGVATRVAPGELLPISVKLSNFGGSSRVDVLVTYSILTSTGNEIYESTETVAVETTADFIKKIQIPFSILPGTYTAETSIVYPGQLVPATAQFSFTVERKFLGLFQSDFLLYGGITLLISIFMIVLGRALVKRRRSARFAPLDYPDIPHDKRIFYEILSDTITQMRQHAGDEALVIAANIDGLKIDMETGRVLDIKGSPAKIISMLVSEYEKIFGKKVSFSFRNS